MAQYDGIVIKSGIPTVLGTDTMRADREAEAGLTTTGLSSGDVCSISAALTLTKASVKNYNAIAGVYDAISSSVVREGVVVATFVSGLTLNAGDVVYLSSTDGQLTNVKSSLDYVKEVGVLVDTSTKKVLLQPKLIIYQTPS
jgi:hypothetical protein